MKIKLGAINEFGVELQSDGSDTGLEQSNFRFEPQRYEGSLAMKGSLPAGVKVQLLDGDTVLGEAILGPPTAGWAQHPFQIQSSGSATAGSVRISLLGKASVKLDQFMLMGQDSMASDGFRPDLLEAVRGLRPPIIRWPGGCFASIYLWKDAIGPQHERRIYIEKVKEFAPALCNKAKELGTPIKILACGGNRFDMRWNRSLIDACASLMDYISIHNYENPDNFATGVSRYEDLLIELANYIGQSDNPDMEIYNSEWNAQSTDWRTGLYAGGLLSAYERQGKKFTLGGPALFLRHTSAGAWDNAFINFDHTGWYPAPNYVVMKLWWDNYALRFLPVSGDQRGCNIVSTRSENGDIVVLKAVNPQDCAVTVEINLDGEFSPKSASMQYVAPGSLRARNTMEDPHNVKPEIGVVRLVDKRLSFEMPAYSAVVVRAN